MDMDQSEVNAFLFELYTQTGGDPESQASMQDIAGRLGIDEDQAGSITESLYFQGLAELKSLSGGMAITGKGLKALNIKPPEGTPGYYSLPGTDVLDTQDKEQIFKFLEDIKKQGAGFSHEHDDLEQYILDMKCIEFHLASPKARTEVVRQLFISIQDIFTKNNHQQISDSISALIG